MKAFVKLEAIAAPLPLSNVDTDKILAARFLKTIRREGLGAHLFDTLRYWSDGSQREDFILNRVPWSGAKILVALENFGCGSSREHAPWALADFGIRCIVAASFADIFYNNCFKNGMLPVVLGRPEVDELMTFAGNRATATMRVDLAEQTVSAAGRRWVFSVDHQRKQDLLWGVDDIARSLRLEAAISAFETDLDRRATWMSIHHEADLTQTGAIGLDEVKS